VVKTKIFLFLLLVIIPVFTGCQDQNVVGVDKYLVIEEGNILSAPCGTGDPPQVDAVYEGYEAVFITQFWTNNYNQHFDADCIVDSIIMPGEFGLTHDNMISLVAQQDGRYPGTAKGVVTVRITLKAPCNSMGIYRLTLAISDSHGLSVVGKYELSAARSGTSSGAECKCVSQCSECSTIFSRYNCGCGSKSDNDYVKAWIEANPGEPVPDR
jgi:hypothetical protein